jgi:catechol 2,3-dioxygenase-like lactoylglutathione lyase family enzyme
MRLRLSLSIAVGLLMSFAVVAQEDRSQPLRNGPPTVIGLRSVGHSVANLEKAVAFYRDVFGLELVGEIGSPASSAAMQKLTNTPGAQYRTAQLRMPFDRPTLELIEFTGVDRTPTEGVLSQSGVPWLSLSVKNEAEAFEALQRERPPIRTLAGPLVTDPSIKPTNTKPGSLGTIFIRDVDGSIVEVLHRDQRSWFTMPSPVINEDAPDVPMVLNLQWGVGEASAEATMRFYYDLLGFDVRPGYIRTLRELLATPTDLPPDSQCPPDPLGPAHWDVDTPPQSKCWTPARGGSAATGGTQTGSRHRMLTGNCDATVRCEFSLRDPSGKPFLPRIQDPGAGFLSVWVRDLDSLLADMKAAGVQIVSAGGKPVEMEGSRRIIVRDPSGGFYVMLIQQDQRSSARGTP